MTPLESVDVVVIGAGIAGSSIANHLDAAGLTARVISRSSQNSPVLSSGFVWPAGLRALDRLGVLEALLLDHPQLRRWIEYWGADTAEATPPWTSPGYCLNPSRPYLEQLIRRGVSQRIGWLWEAKFESATPLHGPGRRWEVLVRQARSGNTHRLQSDWLVVADGRQSLVRSALRVPYAADFPGYRSWQVAVVDGWTGPDDLVVSGFWGQRWFGVSATRSRQVTLSISSPIQSPVRARLDVLAAQVPWLCERLDSPVFKLMGATSRAGSHLISQASGPGWIVIGDAALATEPIAATGISLALLSSELASAMIHSSDRRSASDRYQQWLDRLGNQILDDVARPPTSDPQMPSGDEDARWTRRIATVDSLDSLIPD